MNNEKNPHDKVTVQYLTKILILICGGTGVGIQLDVDEIGEIWKQFTELVLRRFLQNISAYPLPFFA